MRIFLAARQRCALRSARQVPGRATVQRTAEIYTRLKAGDNLKAVQRIDEYLAKATG